MNELKHEFIANGNARNVVRAVRADRGHNILLLVRIFNATVIWKVVVAQEDRHVHFRLLDRLKLWTSECLMGLKYFKRSIPQAPIGYNRNRRDGGAVKHV